MKRWRNVAGSAFAILVMGIVLALYGGDLANADLSDTSILRSLAAATAIYVIVVVIGAFNWAILLRALGTRFAPWVPERQLLVSQIGKYVPGNVAQYLGRAALAINSGISAKAVGVALLIETGVILAGGVLSIAVAVALFPELIGSLRGLVPDPARPMWLGVAAGVFLFLVAAASLVVRRFDRLRGWPRIRPAGLLLATALSTVSFLLLGISLHLVVGALSSADVPISLSVAVFAAAWIAGLATPGAPGGLGVRESVLTLGLAPFVGGTTALTAALLYRGVSVVGDVVALALGLLGPKNGRSEPGQAPAV